MTSQLGTVRPAPAGPPQHRRTATDPVALDAALRSQLRDWIEHARPDAPRPKTDWDRSGDRRRILAELATGGFATTAGGHPVRVVSLGVGPEGETELQLLVGDPSAATAALTWTPGTGHGVHTTEADLAIADAWLERAARQEQSVTVLVDLYDGPDHVLPTLAGGDGVLGEAADPSYARAHAAALRAGVDRLVKWTPPDTRVTAVAHSYGVVALGHAAAGGLDVDAVVLLAGPGAGVRHASDFQLRDGADVWAVRAADDPIQLPADLDEVLATIGSGWGLGPLVRLAGGALAHGPDPTDPDFGATAYRLSGADGDAVVGHAQTGYTQTDFALRQLLLLAHGRDPDLPTAEGAAALRNAVGDTTYGLGTDETRAGDQ